MDQVVCCIRCYQFVLILILIFSIYASGQHFSETKNGSCIPAEDEPTLQADCQPLVKLDKPFCQHYGFKLGKFVNLSGVAEHQDHWNKNLWKIQESQRRISPDFPLTPECLKQARFIGCYYSFPGCDSTTSEFRTKRICKETCLDFFKNCKRFLKVWIRLYLPIYPQWKSLIACTKQPYRNAGDAPECMFYVQSSNKTFEKEDCLYLSGSSYDGNISVTASGITCQSWKEQCPHRHTMNTTYPELNFAENYCRNPHNSGKRPWCFTTNTNKRWDYCNIPQCTPVSGGYGNWTLNVTCSVTCGQGYEVWSRECNNPKPQYGGNDCSAFGNSSEYRNCTRKICAINGGYGNWSLKTSCSATCGPGFEVWSRKCNNPEPKYGGNNCSVLGNAFESRNCTKQLCAEDCIYSNWTKSSSCSVTCGKGYESLSRKCRNQVSTNGKHCCNPVFTRNITQCQMDPCPESSSSQSRTIQITSFVCAFFILMVLVSGFLLKKKFKREQRSTRNDGGIYESILDLISHYYETIPETNVPENPVSEHIYESISNLDLTQNLE